MWLCQIAKNLWYDEIKRKKRYQDLDNGNETLISKEKTEEIAITNSAKLAIFKKMQNLDELTKEVIYLRLTGELSFKEIGNILNKTENWARVIFYRGKQKLKEVDYDERKKKL